jgi:hypothetical protein
MKLIHCIYCSASANSNLSPAELEELLATCRSNNAAAGITGMLLYRAGSFFQVLEGDRTAIEALFEKIYIDKRHRRVIKIIVEPIAERAFAAWTMGHSQATATDLAEIPGLNDFFMSGESFLELGEGRAKTLLAAFQEGRWKASLF